MRSRVNNSTIINSWWDWCYNSIDCTDQWHNSIDFTVW